MLVIIVALVPQLIPVQLAILDTALHVLRLVIDFSDNPDRSTVKQDVETFINQLAPDFVSEFDLKG